MDIEATCKKYEYLIEKDFEMPEVDDFAYALSLYGKPHQMDSILNHESESFIILFTKTT